MIDAVRKADCLQFSLGPLKGIFVPGKLKGHCDVLQCGHRRDQVERLEDNAHMRAAKTCECVFILLRQILPKRGDGAACRRL